MPVTHIISHWNQREPGGNRKRDSDTSDVLGLKGSLICETELLLFSHYYWTKPTTKCCNIMFLNKLVTGYLFQDISFYPFFFFFNWQNLWPLLSFFFPLFCNFGNLHILLFHSCSSGLNGSTTQRINFLVYRHAKKANFWFGSKLGILNENSFEIVKLVRHCYPPRGKYWFCSSGWTLDAEH